MPNGYDDGDYSGEPPAPPERPPDPMVEVAKEALDTFFEHRRRETFYERQLQVLFESRGKVPLTPLADRGQAGVDAQHLTLEHGFYHWITSKALAEMKAEGRVAVESRPLSMKPEEAEEGTTISFFRHPTHRFWKRQGAEILKLVRSFSAQAFGRAMGLHAEMLFDAGMARAGFVTAGTAVREWEGRRWPGGENMDRVYVRDGVAWGAEIKNRLKYIDGGQMHAKLELCAALGLKPLFIARMLPSTYISRIERRGGFGLVFKYQFYPFGHEQFAGEVRERLELPIGHELAQRTIQRLVERGHDPWLARRRSGGA